MAAIVLRVRLVSGDLVDLSLDDPGIADPKQLIDSAVTTLSEDAGVLRCTHGDRLIILFGRAVAAIEVTPRGAVL